MSDVYLCVEGTKGSLSVESVVYELFLGIRWASEGKTSESSLEFMKALATDNGPKLSSCPMNSANCSTDWRKSNDVCNHVARAKTSRVVLRNLLTLPLSLSLFLSLQRP